MSGLSTRSPLLSPRAPGWRSNRLCVIKWWWWLYLTFVKGGAADSFRSVLSASIQRTNPHTDWEGVKVLFLVVNTGVTTRWTQGRCLLCARPFFLLPPSARAYVVPAYMLSPCSRRSLPSPGGGWLHTGRQTLSPWRSVKATRIQEACSEYHPRYMQREQSGDAQQSRDNENGNQLTVRIVPQKPRFQTNLGWFSLMICGTHITVPHFIGFKTHQISTRDARFSFAPNPPFSFFMPRGVV